MKYLMIALFEMLKSTNQATKLFLFHMKVIIGNFFKGPLINPMTDIDEIAFRIFQKDCSSI